MDIPYIDIHTHTRSRDGIYLYNYSIGRDAALVCGELFSAGLHPWDSGEGLNPEIADYLSAAPLSAIGETGLDYFRGPEREIQQQVFRAQLDIAASRNLPVIIHCVRAYNDVLRILDNFELRAVIFHDFTGPPQLAGQITAKGYSISFGRSLLVSTKTARSLISIPPGNIFAETDDRDIEIAAVYQNMAKIRSEDITALKMSIFQNFNAIFAE